MELYVKRHTDTARLPEKAHQGDLGYDIFADEDVDLSHNEYKLISTGISVKCSNGGWGWIIKDRSSMAVKGLFSHAGVIDGGYTGEIKVLLQNVGEFYQIKKGDKIAQLIPTKVTSFEVMETTELHGGHRGSKGFGSTGR